MKASQIRRLKAPAARVQKQERLVARVSAQDKDIITQAAAMSGQSVGSFILTQARKAALDTLESRHRIILNAAQTRLLVDTLLSSSKPPTSRMKRALKSYQQKVVSDVNG